MLIESQHSNHSGEMKENYKVLRCEIKLQSCVTSARNQFVGLYSSDFCELYFSGLHLPSDTVDSVYSVPTLSCFSFFGVLTLVISCIAIKVKGKKYKHTHTCDLIKHVLTWEETCCFYNLAKKD